MASPSRWRAAGAAAAAGWCLGACAPATDLAGQRAVPDAGAALAPGAAALVDPIPGATDVPRNLAAVWLRFATPVAVPDGAFTVSTGGTAVAVGTPAAEACPDGSAGTCARLPLAGALMPASTYVVAVGDGVIDAAGEPVTAGPVGQFVTATDADLTAPAILALSIQPSGPCVAVSLETDEPAAAILILTGPDATTTIPAGSGATEFATATSVLAFGSGVELSVVVEVADQAGNVARSAPVMVSVPAALVPVAITEVHANPAGAEPTQEFVEVRNLGTASVELGGLVIADAKGMDTLPAATLDPGAYALIVASGFDPASPKDTPPRAGTQLVRVDARIGADGLANGGEAVRLSAPDGTVISSYSAALDVSAMAWSGMSVHRVPEDACDQDPSWTRKPEPATPGWVRRDH